MGIELTSPMEINSIAIAIKLTHSSGEDEINPHIARFAMEEISAFLAEIINCSIATGIPSIISIAKVIPIHKGAETNKPNRYRPISTLCNFSKYFEFFYFKANVP